MVQGISRDAWDEFSKTILVRFILSYLCGTLYLIGFFCVIKKIFAFSMGVFLAFQPVPELAYAGNPGKNNWNIVILWSSNFYCSEAFSLTTLNRVDGYRARGVLTIVLR